MPCLWCEDWTRGGVLSAPLFPPLPFLVSPPTFSHFLCLAEVEMLFVHNQSLLIISDLLSFPPPFPDSADITLFDLLLECCPSLFNSLLFHFLSAYYIFSFIPHSFTLPSPFFCTNSIAFPIPYISLQLSVPPSSSRWNLEREEVEERMEEGGRDLV